MCISGDNINFKMYKMKINWEKLTDKLLGEMNPWNLSFVGCFYWMIVGFVVIVLLIGGSVGKLV